jgi:Ca2+-transporting ATPase
VLAFAYKKIDSAKISLTDEELEQGLILVGICGMIDPPRPGVANSVAQCLSAGIVPMMITGDHPATASAIAREVGISGDGSVLTGKELDLLSDKELYPKAMKSRVFARVSPEHKNRIVKILKQNQHVVAMTGDGVNDAPAVKAADIGIAMGIAGTEVTKEASAMVLADDNFSTIVKAVYEGRAIYDNIRKFIRYLLGCNIGEVMVMFLASLLGMPLPLLPIQILWVNLVTDGLPAMALGLEPPEPGIMERKPRERNESIFARQLGRIIFSRGLFISIATLCTFTLGLIYCRFNGIEELNLPRTMAFTTLVFAQLFYVFECRSENFSPFALGFFTNKFLIAAVFGSIIMQLSVIYLPFLQAIFKTVSLLWWQWAVIILVTGFKIILRLLIYLTRQFSFKLGIVIK